MVGFIYAQTLQGHTAAINVETIVTAVENPAGNSDRKKVVVNTLDGKRLDLDMTAGEFFEMLRRMPNA